MDYSHDEEVTKWLKKTNRKGPFHLLRKEPTKYSRGCYDANGKWVVTEIPGTCYIVVWREKEKTKLGYFKDGMYARYGVGTMGVLTGTQVNGLWQSGPGSVSMEDLDAMQRVAVGLSPNCKLDDVLFDPATLENLQH